MKSIHLNPRYSSNTTPSRCIKCLAEQELNNCLRTLLIEDDDNDAEVQRKFEMLLDFLKSPELQKLVDESEKFLSDGKKVTLKIQFDNDKPVYELKVD